MYKSIDDYRVNGPCNDGLVKVHIGCGSHYFEGWCNVDYFESKDTDTHRGYVNVDVWANALDLPASNSSIDLFQSSHVIEHLYRHQTIQVFKEFWRTLKPGGLVVTEMPDLQRILLLLNILPFKPKYKPEMNAHVDMIRAQLYGASWEANDLGYQCHKYVWTRKEFCQMLEDIGYRVVLQSGSTLSHMPLRDMVVIAQKPLSNEIELNSSIVADKILSSYGNKPTRLYRQFRQFLYLFKMSLFNSHH